MTTAPVGKILCAVSISEQSGELLSSGREQGLNNTVDWFARFTINSINAQMQVKIFTTAQITCSLGVATVAHRNSDLFKSLDPDISSKPKIRSPVHS